MIYLNASDAVNKKDKKEAIAVSRKAVRAAARRRRYICFFLYWIENVKLMDTHYIIGVHVCVSGKHD